MYFNVGLPAPLNLYHQFSVDCMVEILLGLKRALGEENAVFHNEGQITARYFVAVVMAIYPDDVTVQVQTK